MAIQWKQFDTDETSHHQVSLLNVMTCLVWEDGKYTSASLSASITSEDSTATEQNHAIIASIDKGAQFLRDWREGTNKIFHHYQDLIDEIPNLEEMYVTKLLSGMIIKVQIVCDTIIVISHK